MQTRSQVYAQIYAYDRCGDCPCHLSRMARRDAYFPSFPPCVACQHTQIQMKSERLYPNSNSNPDPNPNSNPKVVVPNEG